MKIWLNAIRIFPACEKEAGTDFSSPTISGAFRFPMLVTNEVSLSQHADDVHGLWRRNLTGMSHTDPSAKLRLGYLENPAGEGVGIALRAGDGNATVGVICLHPRSMHHGATELRAANLADFAVDTAYRTLGPALLLMKEAVAQAGRRAVLLYGLPNRSSAAVCRRAGLHVQAGGLLRYAKVLNGDHPAVLEWPPVLRALLTPSVGLALWAAERWRALMLKPRLRVAAASFDDPAIDAIWTRRPHDLLLGERTAAMVQWRYGRTGRGDWNLCLARTHSGEAVGTLVWRLRDGVADIGDFFSIDPRQMTASMLNAFCLFVRHLGAHSVSLEFFGSAEVVEQFGRAGLRCRGEASAVVMDIAAIAMPELAAVEHWYLTAFDNDAD